MFFCVLLFVCHNAPLHRKQHTCGHSALVSGQSGGAAVLVPSGPTTSKKGLTPYRAFAISSPPLMSLLRAASRLRSSLAHYPLRTHPHISVRCLSAMPGECGRAVFARARWFGMPSQKQAPLSPPPPCGRARCPTSTVRRRAQSTGVKVCRAQGGNGRDGGMSAQWGRGCGDSPTISTHTPPQPPRSRSPTRSSTWTATK